jgi:hypothetical protein
MGWIKTMHRCDLPSLRPDETPVRLGDIWQCDDCQRYWIRSVSRWTKASEDLTNKLKSEKSGTLPLHRTEAGYPNCSTCDGGGCPDCTDPS